MKYPTSIFQIDATFISVSLKATPFLTLTIRMNFGPMTGDSEGVGKRPHRPAPRGNCQTLRRPVRLGDAGVDHRARGRGRGRLGLGLRARGSGGAKRVTKL